MASSSSSTSFQPWNHEVFLSFRGEDTRKTFVDHLYSALCQKGICTYKDDETLPCGESIAPALFKAIEGSRIAIIVFSENYADSSWCLEELAHIMKCRDERGQLVMPIFYHVDPSYVRKQRGKYKVALDKYELENNNRVESWRKALVDAGNLSGWVPTDIANGYESKVIKQLVDTISNTLCSSNLNVNDDQCCKIERPFEPCKPCSPCPNEACNPCTSCPNEPCNPCGPCPAELCKSGRPSGYFK